MFEKLDLEKGKRWDHGKGHDEAICGVPCNHHHTTYS
jgi:hypothetical protein